MTENMKVLAEKIRAGKKGIRLLFIHQSFPSPYRHIARHYAADEDNIVVVIGQSSVLRKSLHIPGAILMGYELHAPPASSAGQSHPYVRFHEECVRRGQAVSVLLDFLRGQGFVPDVICVHPYWGEALFLDLVYPGVPVLAYGEYYMWFHDPLFDFDPLFPSPLEMRCQSVMENTASALALATATHVQTSTRFQFDKLPPSVQARTSIMHEGVETDWFCPDPDAALTLPPTEEVFSGDFPPLPDYFPRRLTPLELTRRDTVVTYVNRTLEPLRGLVSFLRAIPRIQAVHPDAHIVMVGRTSGGYGVKPPEGRNWRDIFLGALRGKIDLARLHFPGNIPLQGIKNLLAISRAHVYLTYPYTVSLSPAEAMSTGTPLVFSDTLPLRELAGDGEETALFVDFHSPDAIADAVNRLLADPALGARLGAAARQRAIEAYDLESVQLPKWTAVIEALARGEQPVPVR